MRRRLALIIAACLGAAGLAAQVDIAKLGPQVGQHAIDFRLPDQSEKLQTLATVAGPKGTMLVFFRSADW